MPGGKIGFLPRPLQRNLPHNLGMQLRQIWRFGFAHNKKFFATGLFNSQSFARGQTFLMRPALQLPDRNGLCYLHV